jgi:hypothetical protein
MTYDAKMKLFFLLMMLTACSVANVSGTGPNFLTAPFMSDMELSQPGPIKVGEEITVTIRLRNVSSQVAFPGFIDQIPFRVMVTEMRWFDLDSKGNDVSAKDDTNTSLTYPTLARSNARLQLFELRLGLQPNDYMQSPPLRIKFSQPGMYFLKGMANIQLPIRNSGGSSEIAVFTKEQRIIVR